MRLKNFESVASPDIKKLHEESPQAELVAQVYDDPEYTTLFAQIDRVEKGMFSDVEDEETFDSSNFKLVFHKLSTLGIQDGIRIVEEINPEAHQYIEKRLDFYRQLLSGRITKIEPDHTTYYGHSGDDKTKPQIIYASPYEVRLGLERDLRRVLMKGTPEYAIARIAYKALEKDKSKGQEQKTFNNRFNDQNYDDYIVLQDLYQKIRKDFEAKNGSQGEIEHKVILRAADIVAEAAKFNPSRGPSSPYIGSFAESIAWAQLGEGVKAQLRGMRQKINGVDLHNIGRFEGKSGVSKYAERAYVLKKQITFLTEGADDEQMGEFIDSELESRSKKFREDTQREIDRLDAKKQREVSRVEKRNLPDEEREAQLSSIQCEYTQALKQLETTFKQYEHARIQSANLKKFLGSLLRAELSEQEQKNERHKSLAQMALDLHWHFSGDRTDVTREFRVDFINDVPFGDLKRAHKLMTAGASSIDILAVTKTQKFLSQPEINGDYSRAFEESKKEVSSRNQKAIYQWAGLVGRWDGEGSAVKEAQMLMMEKEHTGIDLVSDFIVNIKNIDEVFEDDSSLRSILPGTIPLSQESAKHIQNTSLSFRALVHILQYTDKSFLDIDKLSTECIMRQMMAVRNGALTEFLFQIKDLQKLGAFKSSDTSPLRSLASQAMLEKLNAGEWWSAMAFVETFSLSGRQIQSNNVQTIARAGLVDILSKGQSYGDEADFVPRFIETFKLPEALIYQAASEGLATQLKFTDNNSIARALKIIDVFALPKTFIGLPEIQQAAKENMVAQLRNGNIGTVPTTIKTFSLPKTAMGLPEIQQAAREGVAAQLRNGNICIARRIATTCHIFSEAVVRKLAREAMMTYLQTGNADSAISIIYEFSPPQAVLKLPEIQQAAKENMVAQLSSDDINVSQALNIAKTFHFSEAVIFEVAGESIAVQLRKGSSNNFTPRVRAIIKAISLPETVLKSPEIQKAAREGMLARIKSHDFYDALEIIQVFSLPETVLKSPEIREAVVEGTVALCKFGDKDLINKITSVSRNFLLSKEEKVVIGKAIFPFATRIDDLEVLSKEGFIAETEEVEIPQIRFKATGKELVNKFLQLLRKERVDWGNDVIDKERVFAHPILLDYFKKYVRFDEAGFGEKTIGELKRVLAIEPMKPDAAFVAKRVDIQTLDAKAVTEHQWTEDVVSKYIALLRSLGEAQKSLEGSKVFSQYAEKLRVITTQTIDTYRAKLPLLTNEKARQNLEEKVAGLETVNIRSVQDLQTNMDILLDIKGCRPIIQEAVFSLALRKNPSWMEFDVQDAEANISVANVSKVIEFVDHITNQETLRTYFSTTSVAKKFDDLLDTATLAKAVRDATNVETKGKTPFEILPSRGTLMELSGHIADACWASKYGSIAEKFPNFTALVFKQNPGKEKEERLAGACVVIEATTASGQKLMVIRGLNPIENTINQLKVSDFVRKIVQYVREVADKKDAQVAIVIDDHRGGGASNRNAVFNFLATLKRNPEFATKNRVTGLPQRETDFNGYSITQNCFFISPEDVGVLK